MSRRFYSDYVRHCMRFYTRHEKPKFRTESDKLNWNACNKVYHTLSEEDQVIVYGIYRGADTLADNIYALSVKRGISQDDIWDLVSRVEYQIAKERGIL